MAIFRLGELFCGPGGLAWGAMNANIDLQDYGITHAWANDYDSDTCKTYTKNIDLRHIFALYRKLATVKEVLL